MNRKWIIVGTIMIILILGGCQAKSNKDGSFEEVALSQYKESVFDKLVIEKGFENNNRFLKRSQDKNKINEILTDFKGLKLVHHDGKETPKDLEQRYDLRFINKNTYEELGIYILGKDYIEIYTNRITKVEDEKKNMIEYKHNRDIKRYKIINEGINLKALENKLNDLEGTWDNR